MLWNLVANSLINLLTDHHIWCVGYADGIVITIEGTLINTCFETARYALSKIEEWCHEKGLSVNPNKTEALLVTRKRKYRTIGLSIFDKSIQLKKYVKYLGVHIDQKVTWTKQSTGPKILRLNLKKKPSRQCGLAGRPFGTDGTSTQPKFWRSFS